MKSRAALYSILAALCAALSPGADAASDTSAAIAAPVPAAAIAPATAAQVAQPLAAAAAQPPAAAPAALPPAAAAARPLSDRQILERTLAQLQLAPKAGLFRLGDAKSIRPGDHSGQIPTLRAAMIAFGYLPADAKPATAGADDATLYQEPLVGAVKRFQLETGLQDDGTVGNATRRALRAMDGDRIRMIEQSLGQPEPRHGKRFVEINVAAGLAYAFEDGHVVLVSRVIVGKPSNQTPLFSARVQSVTLNPIWVAPESIVEKEFGGNAHVAKPGPDNPLGKIRIDMPNRYEIFLHSTNQPRFFNHNIRPFSHGCIRVEQIQALARWLVGDTAWQAAGADAALAGVKTLRIPLSETVPVYLQYRTATVSSTGQVIYHADPYQLAAPPPPPAAPATPAGLLTPAQQIPGQLIPGRQTPALPAAPSTSRPILAVKPAVVAAPASGQTAAADILAPSHH